MGFTESVQSLSAGLGRFDGSVEHTFEKIDSELARAVGKLGEMAEIIITQNKELRQNISDINNKES